MRKLIAAALLAAALAGCTTTSATRIAADRAILTTRGNAFTSSEQVERDLYMEAAKQAQAGGFAWFTFQDARDVSRQGVFMTPASGAAQASGNAYGWQGSANYRGPTLTPYTKPGMWVTVQYGNGPKPPGGVDAAEFLALNAPKR